MDDRPVVWNAANRKHLGEDHPERQIQLHEIDEVMNDPERIELYQESREAFLVVGRKPIDRWLVVAWVDHHDGRYPIHARAASRRIIRRLTT